MAVCFCIVFILVCRLCLDIDVLFFSCFYFFLTYLSHAALWRNKEYIYCQNVDTVTCPKQWSCKYFALLQSQWATVLKYIVIILTTDIQHNMCITFLNSVTKSELRNNVSRSGLLAILAKSIARAIAILGWKSIAILIAILFLQVSIAILKTQGAVPLNLRQHHNNRITLAKHILICFFISVLWFMAKPIYVVIFVCDWLASIAKGIKLWNSELPHSAWVCFLPVYTVTLVIQILSDLITLNLCISIKLGIPNSETKACIRASLMYRVVTWNIE